MNTNRLLISHARWSRLEKIAFRFFFVFLGLQLLTENFWGNLFGGALFVWRLSEKIFVKPCLWLNHHFFHFKYISQSWTSFSASLHTIRDTVYLLIALIACIVWTLVDRNRLNYSRLFYWFSRCAIVVLSCIEFSYGVIKLVPVQMSFPSFIDLQKPVGDLSPFDLLWTTFGYGAPYQMFTGFFEVIGAILILFNRTRMAGLLVLASVMVNVVMLNYTYQVGVLVTSFYILLLILFLLAPYGRRLIGFFLDKKPAAMDYEEYRFAKSSTAKWLLIIAIAFIGVSFVLNARFALNIYAKRNSINASRRYSLVKVFTVNDNALPFVENDTVCWRTWGERVVDGKNYVTIATMKPGYFLTYTADRDTARHRLSLHPFAQDDTTTLNFSYTEVSSTSWRLEGMMQKKSVKVELQKIVPDTLLNLLKTKRTIITFDDESSNE